MSFQDMYGQDKPIALLQNSIRRNRVAHAYLFYGMGGIGKKTTAMNFAKALNCRQVDYESCGICASCRKIDHGNHPDVVCVEPPGFVIKIGEIRELQNQMRFRPFEGRKRVFIIDDADKMNGPASNALLKTLEEPTPGNVLILITSRYDRLPRTILSRCQKIRFNPVPRDRVAAFLVDKRSMSDHDAAILAASSQGSIGRVIDSNRKHHHEFRNHAIGNITTAGSRDAFSLLAVVHTFGEDRRSILEKLALLREWLRDVLVLREAGTGDYLIHKDIAESTLLCSRQMSATNILKSMATVDDASFAIERNANKQLTLESMIFKLSRLMNDEEAKVRE